MSAADNGGPAFPFVHDVEPAKGFVRSISVETGMTLRDYFAAKAPITLADAMTACGFDNRTIGALAAARRSEVFDRLAMLRGEYADAMIAERAK